MALWERRETLVMLGPRGRLVLLGSLAPRGLLERGVPQAAWVEKAEKGTKVPRGSRVLMGPQGGQALWGHKGPLDVQGLRAFRGSPALWENRASWDPQA